MGAWDSGPFDNDDALDFLDYLAELAAALIAVANGMPPDGALMSEPMSWAATVPADAQIRAQARAALSRVGGPGSEWRELWEEEGSLAEATAVLDGIRDHL